MSSHITTTIGPILILDGIRDRQMHIVVLFITRKNEVPPLVQLAADTVHPRLIAEFDHATVWHARLTMPADAPFAYD